ncbi:hypothetical protein LTR36_007434 [Oleoguttula mirabilis]|uniref:Prion-inhibition and propagation HeLo domain-containing protein n=1 Tax=Oleoguttula mirabilis TaxID=1507867 RepID=A0AAV9JBG4_9PEZI|nr:hypothetical protein LTR36_007434 [Oleoguttula mirabilis]
MAEAKGAVGTLLPLFNVVVEDFRYIQIARNFDAGYGTARIRLTNAELRFTRWGKSVGLTDSVEAPGHVGDKQGMKGTMEELEKLFIQARRKSMQYDQSVVGFAQETIAQPTTQDDRQALELHEKMCSLSLQYVPSTTTREHQPAEDDDEATEDDQSTEGKTKPRKGPSAIRKLTGRLHTSRQIQSGTVSPTPKRPSIVKKARWALFDKQCFEENIDNITHLLDDLDNLILATEAVRQKLAHAEAEQLGADTVQQIVNRLDENEQARDKLLEGALRDLKAASESAARPPQNGAQTNTFGANNGGMQGRYFGDVTFNAQAFNR